MPRVKLTPIPKLRKKADMLFSKAVRLRDSDMNGISTCITCGVKKHYKDMHAGHFQGRRFPATRWDWENVNAQCAGCNTFNGGEQYKYSLAVDEKYGEGTAKKLHEKAQAYFKVTRTHLDLVIEESRAEIESHG